MTQKIKIYRYEVPVTSFLKKREGIILRRVSVDGTEDAWGEVAPLPPYSKETLGDCLSQLSSHKTLPKHISSNVAPSVSFGLESVLQEPLSDSLVRLPVSCLLMGTADEIRKKADFFAAQGFRSAKLKVATLPLQESILLAKELKGQFYLRIDANRAWELKEALHFVSHFNDGDFEYFEEPLKTPKELIHFPFPFALDESLRESGNEPLFSLSRLKALVVKPTLLGGYSRITKLHELAKRLGIDLILSSLFESGIGIHNIAQLALSLGIRSPLGIDTYRLLKEDTLETPLMFSQGMLELGQVAVNKKLLQEVSLG